MSNGQYNSSHPYHGTKNSRGQRLLSKLKYGQQAVSLKRLERLLATTTPTKRTA